MTEFPDERCYTLAEVVRLLNERGHSSSIAELRQACSAGVLPHLKKRGISVVAHSQLLSIIAGPDIGDLMAKNAEVKQQPEGSSEADPVSDAHTSLPSTNVDETDQPKEVEHASSAPTLRVEEGHLGHDLRTRCELSSQPGGGSIRHGEFQCWYADGQQAAVGTYVHGLLQGPWRQWHGNGQIQVEGAYEDGLPSGLWTTWDESGCKLQEGNYHEGQPHGDWTEYHFNGEVWRKCTFVHGQINGPQEYFDVSGGPLNDDGHQAL